MTFYAALERADIWFASAPPAAGFPPDQLSDPADVRLGRQFNPFRWPHPVTREPLPIPVSDPNQVDRGGGGIDRVSPQTGPGD